MKISIDYSGLEIAHEEMADYFRTRQRAEAARRRRAGQAETALYLATVRHRFPAQDRQAREYWIIVDASGKPVWATDHLGGTDEG